MEPLVRTELKSPNNEEMKKIYDGSHQYDGFAFYGDKNYVFQRTIYHDLEVCLRSLEIRHDDVWVGGFSRSGTHWLAELTWLLSNNLNFDKAKEIEHEGRIFYYDFNPLAMKGVVNEDNRYIVDPNGPHSFFGSLPSPRFLKTHFPLSLLPPKLLDTAKMVYIARDPRDVAVSCFHFYKSHSITGFNSSFKVFWDLFMKGYLAYAPYFSNVKEFWNTRNHPNLLFLFYEELYADLPRTARRVAKFLGQEYSGEDYNKLCDHLNFNNMKKNKSINYDKMLGDDSGQVVRKGVAGGWKQYFDEEMTKQSEIWIAENLKDTDMKYPSMK